MKTQAGLHPSGDFKGQCLVTDSGGVTGKISLSCGRKDNAIATDSPLPLGHHKRAGRLDRRPLDTLSYLASSGYDFRMTSTVQCWLTATLSPTRHKFTSKVLFHGSIASGRLVNGSILNPLLL